MQIRITDPRTSSLHESVVHAMNLRPELTDEYDLSYSVGAAIPEEETDEDLTFLSNSSSRKRHSPVTASPSPSLFEHLHRYVTGTAGKPQSMSRHRRFNQRCRRMGDDNDYWGDFDVPKGICGTEISLPARKFFRKNLSLAPVCAMNVPVAMQLKQK